MSGALFTALIGALLLSSAPATAQEEPAGWYAAAVAAGEIDDAPYRKRIAEVVSDLNAARRGFADVGPLEWDEEGSEGHFRHARWLLHHMKEPWNSGGVTDFQDEAPGSELFHEEGRSAARIALVAVKYIDRRERFAPTDRWLPTVGKRFPWLSRSATTAQIGFAEGIVPEGAEFAGEKWGVVVLSTNADHARIGTRADPANKAPVVCPRDGAANVPLTLLREVPDIVPKELDGADGARTELGFPLTFSFFGGQALRSGAEVSLVRVQEVEIEDEKPERRRPGSKPRKKKPSKKEPKTKTVETPVECYVSTPLDAPLLENPRTNVNSIVVIPLAPLEPGATYRATVTCRVGGAAAEPEQLDLTTTFETAPKE